MESKRITTPVNINRSLSFLLSKEDDKVFCKLGKHKVSIRVTISDFVYSRMNLSIILNIKDSIINSKYKE